MKTVTSKKTRPSNVCSGAKKQRIVPARVARVNANAPILAPGAPGLNAEALNAFQARLKNKSNPAEIAGSKLERDHAARVALGTHGVTGPPVGAKVHVHRVKRNLAGLTIAKCGSATTVANGVDATSSQVLNAPGTGGAIFNVVVQINGNSAVPHANGSPVMTAQIVGASNDR